MPAAYRPPPRRPASRLRWPKACLVTVAALTALARPAVGAGGGSGAPPSHAAPLPLILSTWPWRLPAEAGAAALASSTAAPGSRSARLDAVVAAASACERAHCGGPGHGLPGTCGPGGSPDSAGATTLDAVVVDGPSSAAGGVGALFHTPAAAATARLVLERTTHTLLVGPGADAFAAAAGLPGRANLSTPASTAAYRAWRAGRCQPNFWRADAGLVPDPRTACGPYWVGNGGEEEGEVSSSSSPPPPSPPTITAASHDTLAVVVIDGTGKSAAGATSNGAAHKIAGRVGDAALPGGGAYASRAGGCGSTGDGDTHLRFLPCAHALALLEAGRSPDQAATAAVHRMADAVPGYTGALIVADASGRVGAAAAGWGPPGFSYALARGGGPVAVVAVPNLGSSVEQQ